MAAVDLGNAFAAAGSFLPIGACGIGTRGPLAICSCRECYSSEIITKLE